MRLTASVKPIFGNFRDVAKSLEMLVPAVWIEHTTYRLQGACSAISPDCKTLQ